MNERKKRPNYTKEFKADAVKLVNEQGYSHTEVGRRLGVPISNISRWVGEFSEERKDTSENGVSHRKLEAGLLHHSDRGSQYACHSYQKLLNQFRMLPELRFWIILHFTMHIEGIRLWII